MWRNLPLSWGGGVLVLQATHRHARGYRLPLSFVPRGPGGAWSPGRGCGLPWLTGCLAHLNVGAPRSFDRELPGPRPLPLVRRQRIQEEMDTKAERRMSAARMETEAKVNIEISEEHRRSVVEILGTTLADEFLLYTKTRSYHWNVTGMQFHDLHKFFEAQYKELNEVVDEVAERIRYLGGRSLGTLNEFLQYTRLEEHPSEDLDARGMISRPWGTTRPSYANCAGTSGHPPSNTRTSAPRTS